MPLAPPPSPRDILPPLLACLPTAFASPQPPPALLPLLSPLLRQRLAFLSTTNPMPGSSWLPLLQWDNQLAERLAPAVEDMQIEPHPVSGELELDDVNSIGYRRLDAETLQARLDVEQFGLAPVYVWCEDDAHGGTGPGWKLAELRSLQDRETEGEDWLPTLSSAEDAALAKHAAETIAHPEQPAENEPDDEDAYWASYDRTPGRGPTPQAQKPPALNGASQPAAPNGHHRTQSELDYFARYGAEVQPALDAHDPDEDSPELTRGSTLTGDSLATTRPAAQQHHPADRPNGDSLFPAPLATQHAPADLPAPRALSPSSSSSSVARLEQQAAGLGPGEKGADDDRAQRAVKQHISTDVKSLFRLARGAGMERKEFVGFVKRELECLRMLEEAQGA